MAVGRNIKGITVEIGGDTTKPNLVSIHIFHDDQLQQDRAYIFCTDVHLQNQKDLFT